MAESADWTVMELPLKTLSIDLYILSKRLHNISPGDLSVSDLANELETIKHGMLAIGPEFSFDEPWWKLFFLQRLGPKFDEFVLDFMRNNTIFPPARMSYEDIVQSAVVAEIRQEQAAEMKQQVRASVNTGRRVNGKTKVEVDYCDHCKKSYHTTANCFKLHPELRRKQSRKRRRNER